MINFFTWDSSFFIGGSCGTYLKLLERCCCHTWESSFLRGAAVILGRVASWRSNCHTWERSFFRGAAFIPGRAGSLEKQLSNLTEQHLNKDSCHT
jgi:hypothetical protein